MTIERDRAVADMQQASDAVKRSLVYCKDECPAVDAVVLSGHFHRMRDAGLTEPYLESCRDVSRRCMGPAACALRQLVV